MENKNKTVIKTMTLLNLFLTHAKLNLNEVMSLLHIPKTSAHRMLTSLEEIQLLDKDDDGYYSLGLLFLQFGQLVTERLDIRKIALPVMKMLRDDVEEAVNLIVKYGNEAMYIEKQDTTQPVRLYTEIGRKSPLYAGDSRIILAYLSNEEIETYLNETDLQSIGHGTITDKQKLRNIIEETRKNGYTISKSELGNYTSAVAAPIYDYQGKLVAGISVAGLEVRFSKERLPYLIEKVKIAAMDISKKLGYNL